MFGRQGLPICNHLVFYFAAVYITFVKNKQICLNKSNKESKYFNTLVIPTLSSQAIQKIRLNSFFLSSWTDSLAPGLELSPSFIDLEKHCHTIKQERAGKNTQNKIDSFIMMDLSRVLKM